MKIKTTMHWKVERHGEKWRVVDEKDIRIAVIDEESWAHLIAAAPDLHHELKMLHRAYCYGLGMEARSHAVSIDSIAAINKAEGEI